MLADLDELVLRCRDERAKAYIGEAVACYRAGAYRAAIISTWIAVAFDIIDKIRELSFGGDKAAEELTERFDAITRDNDLTRALQFERDLLANARDKFELVSAQESSDLERLQQDRHRCAHPSRTAAMEVFTPSAELARAHIRSAVDHLLQHEPAQGKAAFEGILKTVESQYFPMKREQALAVLAKTPLRRARASLVRNLVIVLMKAFLKERKLDFDRWRRRREALMCIKSMYPDLWMQTIRQNLSPFVRTLDSVDELVNVIEMLDLDAAFGESLESDQIHRLSEFVRQLPTDDLLILSTTNILKGGPLQAAALHRVGTLRVDEFGDLSYFGLPLPIMNRIVNRFVNAESFDTANNWAKIITDSVGDFMTQHVQRILQGALENDQVRGSFGLPRVIEALQKASKIPAELEPLLGQVRALLAGPTPPNK